MIFRRTIILAIIFEIQYFLTELCLFYDFQVRYLRSGRIVKSSTMKCCTQALLRIFFLWPLSYLLYVLNYLCLIFVVVLSTSTHFSNRKMSLFWMKEIMRAVLKFLKNFKIYRLRVDFEKSISWFQNLPVYEWKIVNPYLKCNHCEVQIVEF